MYSALETEHRFCLPICISLQTEFVQSCMFFIVSRANYFYSFWQLAIELDFHEYHQI